MSNKPDSDEASVVASAASPMYMVYSPDPDDSIDLFDLFLALWRRKLLIVTFALVFGAAGVVLALMSEPVYRAQVVLAPNDRDQGATVPSALGGVASLVGIDLESSSDGSLALATLRSRALAEDFITTRDLLPVLFAEKWDPATGAWKGDPGKAPDLRDAVALFTEKIRTIDDSPGTGITTVYMDWRNPELVAEWANAFVRRANDTLRTRDLAESESRLQVLNELLESTSQVELRQVIYRLIETEFQIITFAQAEVEYAFKIVDPATAPKQRIAPKRKMIVIVATLLGGLTGVFAALLFRSLAERRR